MKASRGAIRIRKPLCETKVSELVHDGYCSHFDVLNSKKKIRLAAVWYLMECLKKSFHCSSKLEQFCCSNKKPQSEDLERQCYKAVEMEYL